MLSEVLGQGEQDASDLALLLTSQVLKLIVRLDGLERLDIDRLSAGGKAMCHARDLTLKVNLYGDHEPLVADRNDLILDRRSRQTHRCFQRTSEPLTLGVDLAA